MNWEINVLDWESRWEISKNRFLIQQTAEFLKFRRFVIICCRFNDTLSHFGHHVPRNVSISLFHCRRYKCPSDLSTDGRRLNKHGISLILDNKDKVSKPAWAEVEAVAGVVAEV